MSDIFRILVLMAQHECEADGCIKLTPANGGRYCGKHRSRIKRHGRLDDSARLDPTPEHYAVLSRIVKTPTCWLWDGYHSCGYGVFQGSAGNARRIAHRIIYGYYYGKVPDGVHIDHMCGNRGCVNPEHLRAVTPKENAEHFVKELRSSNTSGVRGVIYDKKRRRWRARAESNGKSRASYHLTKEQAAAAVKQFRLELHTHNDRDRIAS